MDKALVSIIQAPASTSTWASTPTPIPTTTKAGTEIKTNGAINIPIKELGAIRTLITTGPGVIKTLITDHGAIKIKAGTITNPIPTGDKIKGWVTNIQIKDGVEIKIKDSITTELQAGETQVTLAAHGAHQTHTTGTIHSA